MPATVQTARKEYHCQHCGGKILPGQDYYKRMEGGRVHNSMEYDALRWHRNHSDCQPHELKQNCPEVKS